MAKIHITLVGGQPAPVYNGIAYVNPDKIIFIYSEQTSENAKNIAKAVQIPSEKRKFDPVDFVEIEKKMNELAEKYQNDEVSVNISSGTKNWAYYFGRFPNATVFFVDQNNDVWDFTNKMKSKVEFNADMQFRLYGTIPSEYTKFEDYSEEDKTALTDIIALQKFGENVFFQLVGHMNAHPNEVSHVLNSGSYIKWDKQDKKIIINLVMGKKSMIKELKSPHIREFVLNAGWFEYKVAEILSHWENAKEIWLNPKFKYENGSTKNEIDIIVNTGNKFLFVEVKTQIEDNTDIDKFSKAVENFSGSGSKKLFVTQIAMKEKAKEKCLDNGVISYSLDETPSGKQIEDELFALLNKHIWTIEA